MSDAHRRGECDALAYLLSRVDALRARCTDRVIAWQHADEYGRGFAETLQTALMSLEYLEHTMIATVKPWRGGEDVRDRPKLHNPHSDNVSRGSRNSGKRP